MDEKLLFDAEKSQGINVPTHAKQGLNGDIHKLC